MDTLNCFVRVSKYWKSVNKSLTECNECWNNHRRQVLAKECLACSCIYGLKIADDMNKKQVKFSDTLVDIRRTGSTTYMRDNHAEARTLFQSIASQLNVQRNVVFFVNSPEVLRKMAVILPTEYSQVMSRNSRCDVTRITDALYYIEAQWTDSDAASDFKLLLNRIGATPSLYTIQQVVCKHQATDAPIHDTRPIVTKLKMSSKRNGAYEMHNAAYMMANDVATLGWLSSSSRDVIQNALDGMVCFSNSSRHVSTFFEIVGDEVAYALSLYRPYRHIDVSRVLRDVVICRHQCLNDYIHGVYLVSGGMDAITTSAYCVCQAPRSVDPSRDYVESSYVCCDAKPDSNVLLVTPNPSFPIGEFKLDVVMKSICDAISMSPRVYVILDGTIECERMHDNVALLISDLLPYIQAGSVCLLIAKSFVKYSTLGLGICMCGGIVCCHNDDEKYHDVTDRLAAYDNALNWSSTVDCQILTHILKTTQTSEIALVKSGSDNAKFLKSLWPIADYTPGLPFLSISKSWARWAVQDDTVRGSRRLLTAADIFGRMGISDRDSFSSTTTSYLGLTEIMRLNVGHEGRDELIERYYCLGALLIRKEHSRFPCEVSLSDVMINAALLCGIIVQGPLTDDAISDVLRDMHKVIVDVDTKLQLKSLVHFSRSVLVLNDKHSDVVHMLHRIVWGMKTK